MAHINAHRVRETTTTSGTGSITLVGAVAGHRTFLSALATSDTCNYCLQDGNNYEIGIGTFTSPNTLARTTIIESYSAGVVGTSAITLSGGTSDVFITNLGMNITSSTIQVATSSSATNGGTATASAVIPFDCYVESIYVENESTSLTASDTEYLTFSIINKGTSGSGTTELLTAVATTKTTGGHLGALTQWSSKTFTLNSTANALKITAGSTVSLLITTTTASSLTGRTMRVCLVCKARY